MLKLKTYLQQDIMNSKQLKHYIYVLKLSDPRLKEESNWTEEQNKIIEDHFIYLEKLKSNNILVMAGRTVEKETFGIVIYKAMTRIEALKIMNGDPRSKK